MSFLSRFLPRRHGEAAAPNLSGASMVRYNLPVGYVDRLIAPELIAADRSVPVVLSSLVGLNRLCFAASIITSSPWMPRMTHKERILRRRLLRSSFRRSEWAAWERPARLAHSG